MSDLFVLGNGESRKDIDVDLLKAKGKVYGCNAIFREHELDGLIAVDPMLEHEIYQSGYAHKHLCYFRSWDGMPVDHYEMMLEAQISQMNNKPNIREWKYNQEGHYLSFVIHGTSAINTSRKTDRWKGEGFENVYITWLYGKDKIKQLKEVMSDYYGGGWEGEPRGPEDPGWSSGATAMYIGCKVEQPKTCYLIGMDMFSTTDFINNLYKQTHGYLNEDESAVTPQNWVTQMGRVMVRYKDIQFIKVNPKGNSKVSERMPQWDSIPNLKYMYIDEIYTHLGVDF